MDDQTGNSSAPQQIFNNKNENIQHTLITNNVGISDLNTLHINSTTPAPYNTTYEFYFHLPNDTRIYRVTYSELNLSENVQLLNNGINHIPGYLLPHHYNLQSLIQQQIQQQQLQHPVYQQNDIQQQSLDTTQSTSQVYPNNDTYSNTASNLVNGTVSYSMQDGFQNSS
ncbi:uncharacterized protein OCT59_027314 [Rhizophagus irregularis]|uniref:Uncharacterized protein n=2 Tax=Rhizophagus irregularis TaxID=588596 RepID=U9TKZ2_RHIID|nr:hypothetical protein GLOIN_2v1837639 [Rhizophagus irregularis DAOM 181602=DAOM 197198]EXX63812.1 hypothetical protein RirG_148830 [Rhizophagus irregularis DAOM 197198w]UZO07010.1 hypothetical protein OCT59_027314 [Rhizophagus irregularis]POG77211.1 hypothetical protein GLOIN_2v1837639 [Rhizophagus irregularis DAOM 181602=DAOM 197198]CAG8722349.1 20545_t:CDS:1 [Rhizophagus irregularis]GBC45170.1 hypothetical protein GLOIN_2v1837639 [Rhizophagus irregularis DAOM 181602=DAOM 197198]|eukprot:XP_025184077.1 hypothetical protein GLOIN_2v1837639 [Rhizophagus irregularis DAOM 181602=DAOM 197198]